MSTPPAAVILAGGVAQRPRGVQVFTAGLAMPADAMPEDAMPQGAMQRVDFPAAAWDPFHNVNTPDDLTAARVLASRREARWKP